MMLKLFSPTWVQTAVFYKHLTFPAVPCIDVIPDDNAFKSCHLLCCYE